MKKPEKERDVTIYTTFRQSPSGRVVAFHMTTTKPDEASDRIIYSERGTLPERYLPGPVRLVSIDDIFPDDAEAIGWLVHDEVKP